MYSLYGFPFLLFLLLISSSHVSSSPPPSSQISSSSSFVLSDLSFCRPFVFSDLLLLRHLSSQISSPLQRPSFIYCLWHSTLIYYLHRPALRSSLIFYLHCLFPLFSFHLILNLTIHPNSTHILLVRLGWVENLIQVVRVVNPNNPEIWVGLRMSLNSTRLHPYHHLLF